MEECGREQCKAREIRWVSYVSSLPSKPEEEISTTWRPEEPKRAAYRGGRPPSKRLTRPGLQSPQTAALGSLSAPRPHQIRSFKTAEHNKGPPKTSRRAAHLGPPEPPLTSLQPPIHPPPRPLAAVPLASQLTPATPPAERPHQRSDDEFGPSCRPPLASRASSRRNEQRSTRQARRRRRRRRRTEKGSGGSQARKSGSCGFGLRPLGQARPSSFDLPSPPHSSTAHDCRWNNSSTTYALPPSSSPLSLLLALDDEFERLGKLKRCGRRVSSPLPTSATAAPACCAQRSKCGSVNGRKRSFLLSLHSPCTRSNLSSLASASCASTTTANHSARRDRKSVV